MTDIGKGAARSLTERGGQAAPRRSYRVHASSTVGGAASIATKEHTIEFDATADQSDTLPGPKLCASLAPPLPVVGRPRCQAPRPDRGG